jgi:hypothetical protein
MYIIYKELDVFISLRILQFVRILTENIVECESRRVRLKSHKTRICSILTFFREHSVFSLFSENIQYSQFLARKSENTENARIMIKT